VGELSELIGDSEGRPSAITQHLKIVLNQALHWNGTKWSTG
jgi:hypothetical protein